MENQNSSIEQMPESEKPDNNPKLEDITCPVCKKGMLPLNMYKIMSGDSIYCPCCGTRFDIDARTLDEILKKNI